MDFEPKEFLLELVKNQIIKFGQFELKSGDISPFYIDLRLLPSYPDLFEKANHLYSELIKAHYPDIDYIAGLISAGIPFATGICINLEKSLLQIRSQSKDHGRKKLIEGKIDRNKTVVIVDDLISTGASKLPAIDALNDQNLDIRGIVVLIDRRNSKEIGSSLKGVQILSVFDLYDILEIVKDLEGEKSELIDSFTLWLEKVEE